MVAVMDGANWLQELIDEQCPAALRILDFPHAVEYLSRTAHAAYGADSTESTAWLDEWVLKLEKEDPDSGDAGLDHQVYEM